MRPAAERLDGKYELAGPDDCWVWTGCRGRKGYGYINDTPSPRHAHAVMFERERGPIPIGFDVHHTCENRPCVNPAHLQLMEHVEHSRLSSSKRKKVSDEWRRLIPIVARTRRNPDGIPQSDLAMLLGVCPQTIWLCASGRITPSDDARPR